MVKDASKFTRIFYHDDDDSAAENDGQDEKLLTHG
mgnify:CR=1 FL=1